VRIRAPGVSQLIRVFYGHWSSITLMSFRVAIGRCDCRKPYRDSLQETACGAIEARLASWRDRLPSDLAAVPTELWERERVDGQWVSLGTQKRRLDSGATLVVLQAVVHTWSRPTYLSFGAIGRAYAEGLVVSPDGQVAPAPDHLMWEYR
jgi:hypothetical protein